ncbi:MAG: lysophospholipid acyltransferase family protein [Sphaerochaetaceae bacterium]
MAKIALSLGLALFAICMLLSVFIVLIPVMVMRRIGVRTFAGYWVRACGMTFARLVFWLTNIKLEDVTPVHPDLTLYPRICLMANHTSILDIPAIICGLRIWSAFIAKEELRKIPLLNFWISSLDCIYMKRGSLRASAKAIEQGIQMVEQGTIITIFPEGTRSKAGKIAPFKGGSFKLATRSHAVIIPVVIKGVRGGFEDKKTVRRQHAKIMMLQPIPTENLTPDETRDLPQRVENLIREAYEKL